MTSIIAHRGASAYEVENSLAAFRRAVAEGAHGIELDVHATRDGSLLVHHDETVATKHIPSVQRADVSSYRLANGEPIPTLEEVLDSCGADLDVYIEVKTLAQRNQATLLAAIDGGPAPDRCQVHSFDHRIVRRLKECRPSLPCGVLSVSYPVDPLEAARAAGATVLWQQERLIDRDLVTLAHEAGCRVYAWTVDAPERMKTLADTGVDAICTNTPDIGREVVG